jgi:two-component system, sensor histidine kinase and response regulator
VKTVLIIEDEIDFLEEIATILQHENFEVLKASNGNEGIKLARQYKPDLILCDILMPITDGFDVLQKLKESSYPFLVPFIFMTALAEKENLRKGMEMGADDYLIKPFNREELLNTIHIRLEKYAESQDQINRLKNNIIYSLPHEMQSPLHVIISFSKIMTEFAEIISSKDISEIGNAIYNSGNRLFKIIQKFLMFINIELNKDKIILNKIKINSSKMEDFAKNVAEEFGRKNDLIIKFANFELTVLNDYFFFAFNELINNAFKFSKKGQSVVIEAKKNNNILELNIHDQGTGFPDGGIDKIDAFMQFDRKIMEQQGIGLGLFLAKQIVKLHEGKMDIKSSPKSGTDICLLIPS